MREIEVKAKIADAAAVSPAVGGVKKKLESLGCVFSAPIRQEDTIYTDNPGLFDVFTPHMNVLRLRKENSKVLFTLKRPQENELDAIEHETEVGDIKEMDAILKYLGYQPIVEVKKARQKAKYRDYEICINEVDDLGPFSEVEKFSDSDPVAIQN